MYIYAIDNGYERKYFDNLQTVSKVFLNAARGIVCKYKVDHPDDFGYLDIGIWISVCDEKSHNVVEYWMPSELHHLLRNDKDILDHIQASELIERIIGVRIQNKVLKEKACYKR